MVVFSVARFLIFLNVLGIEDSSGLQTEALIDLISLAIGIAGLIAILFLISNFGFFAI